MFKHIIWDFDGTLFDTYPVMARAFSEAMSNFGFSAPYDEVYSIMKVSMSEVNRFYGSKYGDLDAVNRFFRANMGEFFPYDGMPELLADIVARGGRNYILTHRDKSLYTALEARGMTGLFTDFISADMGFPRKPAPDGLLHLMRKNSITAGDAIVVGDRELDILTGINAGAHTCAFWDGTGAKPGSAEYFADSVAALRGILLA